LKTVKTIEGQNSYDLAIQEFGTLNNLDKILRQVPDLNDVSPFGTELELEATENNLAVRFQATGAKFATGVDSPIAPIFDIFGDTFDDTFN
jgi:hypothetical protein